MKVDKVREIVDRINDGEWSEIKPFFGSFDNALKLISRAGLDNLIDPFADGLEDDRNEILYELLNSNNPEISSKWFKKMATMLNDIHEINGEYFLDLDDLSELSELFRDSYNVSTRNIAKSVLGEDSWEPFWDTTNNVYTDVVEDLNPKNLQRFKEIVFKKLDGKEIELDGRSSDLMNELAEEQSKEESFVVNSQNIERIIKDEDTMNWFFKNDLDDISSELYSLHNNSYNSAYESEFYKKVWNELDEYVDKDGKKDWYQRGNKYRIRVRVRPEQIRDVISEILYQYKKYNDELFYDPGSYLGFITKLMYEGPYDYLDFRVDDYPDSYEVSKNINDNFDSYF